MAYAEISFSDKQEISALDIAQIKVLIDFKQVHHPLVQKMLDSRGVDILEQLDSLTLRNLLYYLRSL
jgi:hypothetical protein